MFSQGVKKIKIGNDCDEIGSWTFLDMRNDFILAAHGSVSRSGTDSLWDSLLKRLIGLTKRL